MERTIAGRYAIGVRLGSGAMADVYAATDLRLDRELAIKLVPEQGVTDVARTRFVREARAAARIAHPNAVAVYDAGNADGFLYLAMERVEGHTLAERLAHGGPIAVPEAVSIAGAVLDALGAAHAAGVVHRDVKPANIIVGPVGIKLVDFGIATLVGEAAQQRDGCRRCRRYSEVPRPGTDRRTASHAGDRPLCPRCGAVRDAHRGAAIRAWLRRWRPALAHRDEPAPDVRTIRPDVPPRVAAVIQTALQKRPTDRYSSAAEMGRVLAPAAAPDYAGETVVFAAAGQVTSSRRARVGRGGWCGRGGGHRRRGRGDRRGRRRRRP